VILTIRNELTAPDFLDLRSGVLTLHGPFYGDENVNSDAIPTRLGLHHVVDRTRLSPPIDFGVRSTNIHSESLVKLVRPSLFACFERITAKNGGVSVPFTYAGMLGDKGDVFSNRNQDNYSSSLEKAWEAYRQLKGRAVVRQLACPALERLFAELIKDNNSADLVRVFGKVILDQLTQYHNKIVKMWPCKKSLPTLVEIKDRW